MAEWFPETKASLRRLRSAWRGYLEARRSTVRVEHITSPMTAEQRAAFDAAFAKMDEAFAAMGTALETTRPR